MKILFYDTKSYDRESFTRELEQYPDIEVKFLKADLTRNTAELAHGYDADQCLQLQICCGGAAAYRDRFLWAGDSGPIYGSVFRNVPVVGCVIDIAHGGRDDMGQ